MAIKTIDQVYINDNGETNEVVCPVCQSLTKIKIVTSSDYSPLIFVLQKQIDTDFGICVNCSSVFNINPEYSKARAEGNAVSLTQSDLSLAVKSKWMWQF